MWRAMVRLSRSVGFGLAVFLVSSPLLHAQTDTTAFRAEQARQFRKTPGLREDTASQVENIVTSEAPASPGDPDLGEQVILKKQEKPQPFSLFGTLSGFYTSNAALTNRNEADDLFAVAEIGVGYQQRLTSDFVAEINVRQAMFRYDEFDELDFESLNAGFGLTYVLRPLWNIALSARYNFNRLTDGSDHHEFFTNHTLTLGLLKTFSFSKAHYGYAGYASIFGWSDPVAPQRDEHGIFLGYRASLTRSLSTELYYRIAIFDYVDGREDLNQTLVAVARYDATSWLSFSLSASLGWNNSDRDVFDYEVFNAGAGIAAAVNF